MILLSLLKAQNTASSACQPRAVIHDLGLKCRVLGVMWIATSVFIQLIRSNMCRFARTRLGDVSYCTVIFSWDKYFWCIFKLRAPPLSSPPSLFSLHPSPPQLFILFQVGPCVFICETLARFLCSCLRNFSIPDRNHDIRR